MRMVRSKARFSFKQYIHNKPCKWGFKLWCLCDSCNGYTVSFSVYWGKTGETISGKGLGYDVVFDLLKDFLDQGYSLYVDNFYTSPALANDLFSSKTNTTGTLEKEFLGKLVVYIKNCLDQILLEELAAMSGMNL